MTLRITFILITLLTLSSCKDFISKNISGKTPVLLTPTLLDSVNTNPVHFKWELLEGATKYHLQIVRPSFEKMDYYVLDTLVSTTNFDFQLDSSEYELKLTAINAGYESQTLGPIKFWVGAKKINNSVTTIQLKTPTNNTYVGKDFDGIFSWEGVTNGTNYEFELRKGGTFTTGTNIYTMDPGNTLSKTLPSNLLPLSPGQYSWRVIANANTSYLTQTIGNLFVDTLPPLQASLLQPSNNSSVLFNDSIQFSWNNGTQTETFQSPVTSILEISTDLNFSTIVYTGNFTSLQSKKIKLNVLISNKQYYWRITNKDAAGNQSLPSPNFQFIAN